MELAACAMSHEADLQVLPELSLETTEPGIRGVVEFALSLAKNIWLLPAKGIVPFQQCTKQTIPGLRAGMEREAEEAPGGKVGRSGLRRGGWG